MEGCFWSYFAAQVLSKSGPQSPVQRRWQCSDPSGGLGATAIVGRVMRPAAQYLFFYAKEKTPKERCPNCLRPPLALREPAVPALGGVWLNSLTLKQRQP